MKSDLTLDKFRLKIMQAIAHSEEPLPVVDAQGRRPVVVGLDDERLAVLLGRVRAVGGFANVFSTDGNRIRSVAFLDRSSALGEAAALDMASVPESERPGVDASVGVFFDLLAVHPEGVLIGALGRAGQVPPTAVASSRDPQFA